MYRDIEYPVASDRRAAALEADIDRLGLDVFPTVAEYDHWLMFATPERLGGMTPGEARSSGFAGDVYEELLRMQAERRRSGHSVEGTALASAGGIDPLAKPGQADAPGDSLPF